MLDDLLVGAVVSLLLLVVVLGYLVRRRPQLFVAERLAERIHDDGEGAGPDASDRDRFE